MLTQFVLILFAPLFWMLRAFFWMARAVLGEDRMKRYALQAVLRMMQTASANQGQAVVNLAAQQGMAADFLAAREHYGQAMGFGPAPEMHAGGTPESIMDTEKMTETYGGATVERIQIVECADGSTGVIVATDRGTLGFRAAVLELSDSTRGWPLVLSVQNIPVRRGPGSHVLVPRAEAHGDYAS